MKTYTFLLDKFQFAMVSSSFREKTDVIRLWMNAIKLMTVYSPPTAPISQLVVKVDKMNRLFLSSDGKCVSVNFPFTTYEKDGKFEFSAKSCGLVDSRISSNILSLLAADVLMAEEIVAFAEPIMDICEFDKHAWGLLRDLVIADDGYLRFDHDPERENGRIHPINHIDVFYSQSSTFKLGLLSKLSVDELSDVLSSRTDCHFLTKS